MFQSLLGKYNINQLAKMLKTTPEALQKFEDAYRVQAIEKPDPADPFATSVKQANAGLNPEVINPDESYDRDELAKICARIVIELINNTVAWEFDGRHARQVSINTRLSDGVNTPVELDELKQFPESVRPMLTGRYTMVDMSENTGADLLWMYHKAKTSRSPKKRAEYYNLFRQGLDILDLDPISYAMLGTNPNAMSHWLPHIAEVAAEQGELKIPATVLIRVPITLLQLTRLDYERLNPTTRNIINQYCMQVFNLDTNRDYFVKTGTYSSKFDFRNAHVTAGKEVTELGEYLIYISNRAVNLAGPLMSTCIYGMSTTNEWAVREYIPDAAETKLSIYKGMPLRPEYRLFVDFDNAEIIGANPYWDAKLMEKRFAEGAMHGNDHDKHDYVIYLAAKDMLYAEYNRNIEKVKRAVQNLVNAIHERKTMTGQWSIDIMQNGDEFYLIDMAWAQQSALYDCVPEEKRLPMQENWLPEIPENI